MVRYDDRSDLFLLPVVSLPNDYLVQVVVLTFATAAALAPPRRPRPLAKAAFLAGMVVNEHVIVESLPRRAALAAGLLAEL